MSTLERLSDAELRKVHLRVRKGVDVDAMSTEELRESLADFPETLINNAIGSMRLRLAEEGEKPGPTPEPEPVFAPVQEDAAPVASAGPSKDVIALKKWVKGELEGVNNTVRIARIESSRLVAQAKAIENGYESTRQGVLQSIETQNKLLRAGLDQISNTVVEYIATGGNQHGQVVPLNTHIHLPDGKELTLEGQHTRYEFEKCLRLLQAGLNAAFVGPKGSGKSTLAKQLAQALRVPYYRTDLSGGKSESELTARLVPLGAGGSMRPVASAFLCGYAGIRNVLGDDGMVWPEFDESAVGLCNLEEFDAADPNVTVVITGALGDIGGGNYMNVESFAAIGRSTLIQQGKRNVVTACMNTFGTGMDIQYAGRQSQDAAVMDRFYMVYIGYDSILEAKIGNLPIPLDRPAWVAAPEPSLQEWKDLAVWVLNVRKVLEAKGVKRDWGTRSLLKAKAARYAGIPSEEIKRDLLLGLPADVIQEALNPSVPVKQVTPGQALAGHL